MGVCGLFYTELELIPKNLAGDDIIIEGVGEESEVEGEHDVNANSGMLNDAIFYLYVPFYYNKQSIIYDLVSLNYISL